MIEKLPFWCKLGFHRWRDDKWNTRVRIQWCKRCGHNRVSAA